MFGCLLRLIENEAMQSLAARKKSFEAVLGYVGCILEVVLRKRSLKRKRRRSGAVLDISKGSVSFMKVEVKDTVDFV